MITGKKEVIYSFILSWVSKFVTYLLLLVLANLYLVESYGEVSFIFAIFNIVLFFCVMGLADIFVPWLMQDKDSSSIFYFLLFVNFIFVIIGLFILPFYPIIYPLLIALPFLLFYYLGIAILRIKYKYHISKLLDVIFIIITLISSILFIKLDKLGIILAYSIGWVLSSLIMILITREEVFNIISSFRFNIRSISEYFKKGIITSLLVLSLYFLNWLDSVILGILSSFSEVAKYNVASPISNVITAIPISLSLFLLTRTSGLVNIKDSKISKDIMSRTLRISYSLSLLTAILIVSFIPLLIKIFFPKYLGVELYAMILFIGAIFFSIYNPIYTHFIGELKPEKAFLPIFIAALLNIILDVLLIPNYGLFGICIATSFAHLVGFTLLAIKTKIFKEFIFVYPLTLLVVGSYFLGYYGLLLIPLSMILLVLTKLIKIEDIKIIKDTILNSIKFNN